MSTDAFEQLIAVATPGGGSCPVQRGHRRGVRSPHTFDAARWPPSSLTSPYAPQGSTTAVLGVRRDRLPPAPHLRHLVEIELDSVRVPFPGTDEDAAVQIVQLGRLGLETGHRAEVDAVRIHGESLAEALDVLRRAGAVTGVLHIYPVSRDHFEDIPCMDLGDGG